VWCKCLNDVLGCRLGASGLVAIVHAVLSLAERAKLCSTQSGRREALVTLSICSLALYQGCDSMRFAPCWHSSCVTLCPARDCASVHLAMGLLVMESGSARQRTTPRRSHSSCVPCLVAMVLLWGSVASVESPSVAVAAVYECRDATGRTVLTNRPRSLHHCEMRIQGTASVLPPPMNSDRPSPPSYTPLPPTLYPEDQWTSIDPLSAPNPVAPSSPSPSAPCARGFNPLNPLSAPPCVRSDQSGAQRPVAPPTPSP
jgi:hypothetical protein